MKIINKQNDLIKKNRRKNPWVIEQGDALELMKNINDESIDLITTDPPYFVFEKQDWDMQWQSVDEYFNWFSKIYNEMIRVLKIGGQMYVFFSQKYMFEYASRFKPDRMLIWWHRNLSPPTNNMWLYQYDPLFYHRKGKPNYFNGHFSKGMNSDVLEYSKPQSWKGHERYHPAEKNVEMIVRLINISSKEDDVVLDPFMGGGTTGVACINAGRKFIGFEMEKKYFDIAKERLEDVYRKSNRDVEKLL